MKGGKGRATTGFGSGIVLAWAWNAFLVPAGWPELPAEIAAALAAMIYQGTISIGEMFDNNKASGDTP